VARAGEQDRLGHARSSPLKSVHEDEAATPSDRHRWIARIPQLRSAALPTRLALRVERAPRERAAERLLREIGPRDQHVARLVHREARGLLQIAIALGHAPRSVLPRDVPVADDAAVLPRHPRTAL